VTLVTGTSTLTVSDPLIQRINVVSASEMYEQCLSVFSESDIVFMAAAVADYTIENPDQLKIKKKGENLTLTLTPTIDILKKMGEQKKTGQTLVGFALETDHETENADKKLSSKNLDFIILNSLNDPGAGFGFETNKVTILNNSGVIFQSGLKSKKELANEILNVICQPS
jgi:phosphopantothenoylcysteine decarboxylase/phosphopantothenate--cysteine ligase